MKRDMSIMCITTPPNNTTRIRSYEATEEYTLHIHNTNLQHNNRKMFIREKRRTCHSLHHPSTSQESKDVKKREKKNLLFTTSPIYIKRIKKCKKERKKESDIQ